MMGDLSDVRLMRTEKDRGRFLSRSLVDRKEPTLYERCQGMLEGHSLPLIASATNRRRRHKMEGRSAHRILIRFLWGVIDLGNGTRQHGIIIGMRAGALVVDDRLRRIENPLRHEETRGRLRLLRGRLQLRQRLGTPIRGMDGDVPKGLRHILRWRSRRGRVLWGMVDRRCAGMPAVIG